MTLRVKEHARVYCLLNSRYLSSISDRRCSLLWLAGVQFLSPGAEDDRFMGQRAMLLLHGSGRGE